MATNTYISPNMVAQSIVNEFCRGGELERSIETVKAALHERRDALADALSSELPDAKFRPPEGGYFMWVELPEGTDVDALAAAAKEAGVVFVKGTDFLIEGGQNTLRLAYSGVTTEQVDEGVTRLAAAYRQPERRARRDRTGAGRARRSTCGGRATSARLIADGFGVYFAELPDVPARSRAAVVVPVAADRRRRRPRAAHRGLRPSAERRAAG